MNNEYIGENGVSSNNYIYIRIMTQFQMCSQIMERNRRLEI